MCHDDRLFSIPVTRIKSLLVRRILRIVIGRGIGVQMFIIDVVLLSIQRGDRYEDQIYFR